LPPFSLFRFRPPVQFSAPSHRHAASLTLTITDRSINSKPRHYRTYLGSGLIDIPSINVLYVLVPSSYVKRLTSRPSTSVVLNTYCTTVLTQGRSFPLGNSEHRIGAQRHICRMTVRNCQRDVPREFWVCTYLCSRKRLCPLPLLFPKWTFCLGILVRTRNRKKRQRKVTFRCIAESWSYLGLTPHP
jgi:hypothetical protein